LVRERALDGGEGRERTRTIDSGEWAGPSKRAPLGKGVPKKGRRRIMSGKGEKRKSCTRGERAQRGGTKAYLPNREGWSSVDVKKNQIVRRVWKKGRLQREKEGRGKKARVTVACEARMLGSRLPEAATSSMARSQGEM